MNLPETAKLINSNC